MALTPSAGHQLYLYRLLAREFGVGRQAFLPKVEEALAADDIDPADLDCADVRELLSRLDFVTLTDFKGGRTYVTVNAREDFNEALAVLESAQDEAKPAKKGSKPWKRKKAALKPLRPVHRAKPAPQPAPAPQEEPPVAETPQVDGAPAASQEEAAAPLPAATQETSETSPEPATEPQSEPVEAPAPETSEVAPVPSKTSEPESEPAPEPAPEPEPVPEPSAPTTPEPSIRLTVVSPAPSAPPEPPAPKAEPAPAAPAPQPSRVPPLPRGLPADFRQDVRCPDDILATLTRMLPFDTDVIAVLDEAWRIARATGTLRTEKGAASFELPYLHQDGSPISVGLRRQAHVAGTKRWMVVSVDGTEGGLEAARTFDDVRMADEGPWADLSAALLPPYRRRALKAELARTMSIGSWDDLCTQLASVAAPESWGPADAQDADRWSVLREYVLVSLTRAVEQGRLPTSADGSVAVWNTGLHTSACEAVVCLLGPAGPDGARPLVDVATATDPRVAAVGALPLPATYLSSLGDVLVQPQETIACAPRAHISPAVVEAACARVHASWRQAVPVWDPQEGAPKLLLPAADVPGQRPGHALVVRRGDTGLEACALLSLPRAYACARVVSSEQPAWLAGALDA